MYMDMYFPEFLPEESFFNFFILFDFCMDFWLSNENLKMSYVVIDILRLLIFDSSE